MAYVRTAIDVQDMSGRNEETNEDWNYHNLTAERRVLTGAFATPDWVVKKMLVYLNRHLPKYWQWNYHVWDPCAGTGNLLSRFIPPWYTYCTTLEAGDVAEIHRRIDEEDYPCSHCNVAQFDFLCDPFSKLPPLLQRAMDLRLPMIVILNPPYSNRSAYVKNTYVYKEYGDEMRAAKQDTCLQFLHRIHREVPCDYVFAITKIWQAGRQYTWWLNEEFNYPIVDGFIVPAYSFDGVVGNFAILCAMYNMQLPDCMWSGSEFEVDMYDEHGQPHTSIVCGKEYKTKTITCSYGPKWSEKEDKNWFRVRATQGMKQLALL